MHLAAICISTRDGFCTMTNVVIPFEVFPCLDSRSRLANNHLGRRTGLISTTLLVLPPCTSLPRRLPALAVLSLLDLEPAVSVLGRSSCFISPSIPCASFSPSPPLPLLTNEERSEDVDATDDFDKRRNLDNLDNRRT